MIDLINQCYIKAGYQSGHSIVCLKIIESKFQIGNLDLINRIIDKEILNYKLPIYNVNLLKENYKNTLLPLMKISFWNYSFLELGRRQLSFPLF